MDPVKFANNLEWELAYFKVLFRYLPRGTEDPRETLLKTVNLWIEIWNREFSNTT
jgi:general stress protein 26